MVKTFFETRSVAAVQLAFRDRFPERDPPAKKTIWQNVKKYRENGTSLNLNKGRSGRPRTGRSEDNIAAVRVVMELNPANASARRNGIGLPSATFNRITRLDLRFHPYRMHVRHQLLPGDLPRRMRFVEWLMEKCENDARFLESLVVGDEAAFHLNGRVNSHNVLKYAPVGQSPEFNFDRNMSREKLNVWVGVCGNGTIIGPFFYEMNLNGAGYLQLLNENVIPAMERNFLRQGNGVFRHLWWAQDGAPAHRLIAVRNRLQELFAHRVIAMHHDVEWPPRSPDLTPCDFFLWGHLKNEVYSTPPHDIADLRARIEHEITVLREDPAIVRRAVNDMSRRCALCVDREGGHVEGVGA